MNKSNRIAEPIPALEMLKALNTLQHSSQHYQEELSFGYKPNESHQEKRMDFQIYMEKKAVNPSRTGDIKGRKSVTPLKDTTKFVSNISQGYHIERKSLSPNIVKNSSFQKPQQAVKKPPYRVQNNKENINQKSIIHSEKHDMSMSNSKLSYHTKKILSEKQKKGKAYVPIQKRADELLKEREMKIVKLQKEKEVSKMIEEKECTFRPKLTRNFAKIQAEMRKSIQTVKKQESISQIKDVKPSEDLNKVQTIKADWISGESNLQVENLWPNQTSEDKSTQQIGQEGSSAQQQNTKVSQETVKKYKNDKFNKLLDFLL